MNIYRRVEGVKIDEVGGHFDSNADSNRMEQGISRVSGNTPGVAGIIPQRWPCLPEWIKSDAAQGPGWKPKAHHGFVCGGVGFPRKAWL